jgi:hypothetical protein
MRIRGFERASGTTIEELKASLGAPSPFKDTKKSILMVGISRKGVFVRGTAIVNMVDGDLEVYAVRALESGAGYMMVKRFCDLADKYGLGIDNLHPSPYDLSVYSSGVRRLRKRELIAFYEQFGFVYDKATRRMSRQPIDTTP